MNFKDMYQELRSGEPNRKKTVKTLCIYGAILLLFVLINLYDFLAKTESFDSFELPDIFLGLLAVLGIALLAAAYGIHNKLNWGERIGQLAIILVIMVCSLIPIVFFLDHSILFVRLPDNLLKFAKIPTLIFLCIAILQCVIPAYLSIGYLNRLRKQREKEEGMIPPTAL